jgi:hypothetical protein
MTQNAPGQMTWKSSGQDCNLFLRHTPADPWEHYQKFPQLIKPDPKDVSAGFATFIALMKNNWETVQSL